MKSPMILALVVLAGAAALAPPRAAAQPAGSAAAARSAELDKFLIPTHFHNVKVSPDGRYFAASTMSATDTGALVVLEIATHRNTGLYNLRRGHVVHDFDWVSDKRLVYSLAAVDGSLAPPEPTGELYGGVADGDRPEVVFGPGSVERGERAFLVDTLIDDDKSVLIGVRGAQGGGTTLERVNLRGGRRTEITRVPLPAASFLLDAAHRPRFAWGTGTDRGQKVYYNDGDGGWGLIHDERSAGARMTPLGFARDDRTVYMRVEERQGPDSLHAWNAAARTRQQIARDDSVDPARLLGGADSSPWAVLFHDEAPRLEPLVPDSAEDRLHRSLAASFSGNWISIINHSRGGGRLVFRSWSDRNPGDFYLYDRSEKRALYLMSERQWIDPELMAAVQPVSYQASDGVPLHGFLTVPRGGSAKRLPLIARPHRGPIGPFERWGFDAEAQLFASRGYAVLQLDYRGSGNHGRAFRRAGAAAWGTRMADDLADAVRAVVAGGTVDPARVCVYGHGYGAYLATQALRRTPNLFKCGVGYAGVYDMVAARAEGLIGDGSSEFAEGPADGLDLDAISPARHAASVLVPMFLIVGNADTRVRPTQSQAMRDGLRAAGKPVEWLEKDEEGHGFLELENNRELYTRMLAFFDKHIGRRSAAAGAVRALL
jgi:dipeptidyl aminopeptidase/acylaminoacyl peptidase